MSPDFATTVALVIPVILFAAGAEARSFVERTRELRAAPPPLAESAMSALFALRGIPSAGPATSLEELEKRRKDLRRGAQDLLYTLRHTQAKRYPNLVALWLIGSLWAVVIAILIVLESLTLAWLSAENPHRNENLAIASLVFVLVGMAMLFITLIAQLSFWSPVRLLPSSAWEAIKQEVHRIAGSDVVDSDDNPSQRD